MPKLKPRIYEQYSEEVGTRPSTVDDQNWNRGFAAADAGGARGVSMPERERTREYVDYGATPRAIEDEGAAGAVVEAPPLPYESVDESRQPRETTMV